LAVAAIAIGHGQPAIAQHGALATGPAAAPVAAKKFAFERGGVFELPAGVSDLVIQPGPDPSVVAFLVSGCATKPAHDKPEYFPFRPELEKHYGYSHAVRIGDHVKISGAVSMNDKGELLGAGDLQQQMKNC
jgi:enamine deaminase RidA (YjgF/YER057c/UK114 family)